MEQNIFLANYPVDMDAAAVVARWFETQHQKPVWTEAAVMEVPPCAFVLDCLRR